MSHSGPCGPAAISISFSECLRNDESISHLLGQDGMLKLILINYGTKGDQIAIDDLVTASANCSKLMFMAVNAHDLTPALMREFHEEQWGLVINTENCHYNGSACLYDCNGQLYSWRGGPGDRGFSGFPVQTPIHYQHGMMSGDRIVVSNNEGSATEYLDQVMTNGAYFDRPDEIHIVFPDDAKLVGGTYALRDMASAIFDGKVKLVSYLETLLTNQISDKHIKYIAVSSTRSGHMYDFECNKHRPIERVGQRYIWSIDPERLAAYHKQAMGRLMREGLSGSFYRGEVNIIAEPASVSSSHLISFDEPAHFGWNPPRMAKGPKGPITMPGLEKDLNGKPKRKKKGTR